MKPSSRLAAVMVAFAAWMAVCSFTVVIDAGHGGNDHGCSGSAGVREKDINLAVAKRVAKLINDSMPDAKALMTRSKDNFVTLQGRCDFANRNKGDIFVSIHTNSVDAKSPNRQTVSGASVYTLGLSRAGTNLDVAMRENSVMRLEDDYTTTYCGFDPTSAESYIVFEMSQSAHMDQSIKLAQNIQNELTTTAGRRNMGVRQEPFWVLVRTSMPAVLVELDFVCNPDIERYLGSDEGRDQLARAIYRGIRAYRGDAIPKAVAPRKSKSEKAKSPTPTPAPENNSDAPVVYKVQFLTMPRKLKSSDKRLRSAGEDVDSYSDSGAVKYTVGAYLNLADAQERLRHVKKNFPDAFIITTRNGQRIK